MAAYDDCSMAPCRAPLSILEADPISMAPWSFANRYLWMQLDGKAKIQFQLRFWEAQRRCNRARRESRLDVCHVCRIIEMLSRGMVNGTAQPRSTRAAKTGQNHPFPRSFQVKCSPYRHFYVAFSCRSKKMTRQPWIKAKKCLLPRRGSNSQP